jgi:hypothetical protein
MKIRVAFVMESTRRRSVSARQVALSYATADIEIGIISTPASPYIQA